MSTSYTTRVDYLVVDHAALERQRQARIQKEMDTIAQMTRKRQQMEDKLAQAQNRLNQLSQRQEEAYHQALKDSEQAYQQEQAALQEQNRQMHIQLEQLEAQHRALQQRLYTLQQMSDMNYNIMQLAEDVLKTAGTLQLVDLREEAGKLYLRFAHLEDSRKSLDVDLEAQEQAAQLHIKADEAHGYTGDACHELMVDIMDEMEAKGFKTDASPDPRPRLKNAGLQNPSGKQSNKTRQGQRSPQGKKVKHS